MTGLEKYPMVDEESKVQKGIRITYNDIRNNLSDLLKFAEEIRDKADITEFIVKLGYYPKETAGDNAHDPKIFEIESMVDEMDSVINSIRTAIEIISLKLSDIQNIIGS